MLYRKTAVGAGVFSFALVGVFLGSLSFHFSAPTLTTKRATLGSEFRTAPVGSANFRPRISVAYHEVLGRADGGDPGGLTAWNQQMVMGKSEAQLRETFLRHPDYALTHQLPDGSIDYSPVVILAYLDFLGGVDPNGLPGWVQNIAHGMTEAEMRERFLRDRGYANSHRNQDGSVDYSPIINAWYVRILGRVKGGEPAGVAEWNRQMNNGLTEEQLRESFIRSEEYALKNPAIDPPPPPPPPPTPPPGGMPVLTIVNGNFSKPLVGAVVCCPEVTTDPAGFWTGYPQNGWPLVSDEVLTHFAVNYSLNYTHVRSGPFSRFAEQEFAEGYIWNGSAYDLNQFNPVFVQRLRHSLETGASLGVYIEVDLIDGWPIKQCPAHPTISPWCEGNNAQGVKDNTLGDTNIFQHPPQPHHEAWIRHIVSQTCAYPNVIYQIGNEIDVVHSRIDWELGVYTIAKDEMRRQGCSEKLVGSNSLEMINIDYRNRHQFVVPAPEPIPTMVNETDNEVWPYVEQAVRGYMARSHGNGYFQAWRGPLSTNDFLALLEQYRRLATGQPPPTGFEAPLFGCTNPFQRIRVKVLQHPTAGKYVMDATPLPNIDGEGGPATLRCHDVWIDSKAPKPQQEGKGPRWRLVSGTGFLRPNDNQYLMFYFPEGDPAGTVIEACSQDGLLCGTFTFPSHDAPTRPATIRQH